MIRLHRSLALAGALLASPGAQAAPGCAGLEPSVPMVATTVSEPATPRIVAASADELRARAGVAAAGDALTRGLTVDRVVSQARITLATLTGGGSDCIALKEAQASVVDEEVTVLIDSTYGPGTCQYRAVLEHEREHVRINARALAETGRLVRQGLEEVAARWAGRWVPAEQERLIRGEVDRAVEDAVRRAHAAADERNRAIDLPASYAAVQARCDSW